VTVGLPSIVSTLVGWYCSSEVLQGGSCCSRSIAIGAYRCASRWAALSPDAAALAGETTAASATIPSRTRRRALTGSTYRVASGAAKIIAVRISLLF